jgi:hypothetical protein
MLNLGRRTDPTAGSAPARQVVPYPAAMPEASYYAEAFSALPGRCFRLVAHPGEAGATHCPEPVAWRGSWRAPNGRAVSMSPTVMHAVTI